VGVWGVVVVRLIGWIFGWVVWFSFFLVIRFFCRWCLSCCGWGDGFVLCWGFLIVVFFGKVVGKIFCG